MHEVLYSVREPVSSFQKCHLRDLGHLHLYKGVIKSVEPTLLGLCPDAPQPHFPRSRTSWACSEQSSPAGLLAGLLGGATLPHILVCSAWGFGSIQMDR